LRNFKVNQNTKKNEKGDRHPKSCIYHHIYFSAFLLTISLTIAETLLLFISVLIICFITSDEVSAAISFIFVIEDFFKSFISFSVAIISFSISSLNFVFLSSKSLFSFFLLSSIIFFASFLEFSIIILYSSNFFSALSFNF